MTEQKQYLLQAMKQLNIDLHFPMWGKPIVIADKQGRAVAEFILEHLTVTKKEWLEVAKKEIPMATRTTFPQVMKEKI